MTKKTKLHDFFSTFQEKIGDDKNSNSSHDFKTLADVLIQETVRFDMGQEFPELKGNIQGSQFYSLI